jgi:hypothetical protein
MQGRRMATRAYLEICEALFRQWLNAEPVLSPWAESKLPNDDDGKVVSPHLYCPEPYLVFGHLSDRVAFLTTNPGNGMWFQKRDGFGTTDHPVRAGTYRENAVRLAAIYSGQQKSISATASNRVLAMLDLAQRLQPDLPKAEAGFTQFEVFPFHSKDLKKAALSRLQAEIPEYQPALAEHLERYQIVCAIAGACHPASRNKIVQAFGAVLGIDPTKARFTELQRKGDKPTVGFFAENQHGKVRAIFCSCPYNVLPARDLRAAVARALLAA